MMDARCFGTRRIIPFLIVVCSLALGARAQYGGGTGEPNDPYLIGTAADLIALGETPEHYDKHFILTADIDLDPDLPGPKVFHRAVIAPLGPWGSGFAGDFDGNGVVDLNDLFTVRNNFGSGAAEAPMPEPATITMLGAGAALLLRKRR